jgi:nucleoside-diphosphate kinase
LGDELLLIFNQTADSYLYNLRCFVVVRIHFDYNDPHLIKLKEAYMTTERTLSIIKPDAVKRQLIGKIYERFAHAELTIVNAKMVQLTRHDAEKFYHIHRKKPFFHSLTEYMSSSPIMVQVLEGDNAVLKYRDIMGATHPSEAAPGTIRADFAHSIEQNSVHGSDSVKTAALEIEFFFQKTPSLYQLSTDES